MRTDAMLKSSIVLLMIVNTVAASAAPFVALLATRPSGGDDGCGQRPSPDSRQPPHQEEEIADAA